MEEVVALVVAVLRKIGRDDADILRILYIVNPAELSAFIQIRFLERMQILRDGVGCYVLIVIETCEDLRLDLVKKCGLRRNFARLQRRDLDLQLLRACVSGIQNAIGLLGDCQLERHFRGRLRDRADNVCAVARDAYRARAGGNACRVENLKAVFAAVDAKLRGRRQAHRVAHRIGIDHCVLLRACGVLELCKRELFKRRVDRRLIAAGLAGDGDLDLLGDGDDAVCLFIVLIKREQRVERHFRVCLCRRDLADRVCQNAVIRNAHDRHRIRRPADRGPAVAVELIRQHQILCDLRLVGVFALDRLKGQKICRLLHLLLDSGLIPRDLNHAALQRHIRAALYREPEADAVYLQVAVDGAG